MKKTNEETSVELAAQARKALLGVAANEWQNAEHALDAGIRAEIDAINHLRSVGLRLQEACDRIHATAAWYFGDEARPGACKSLPATLSLEAVKTCFTIAKLFKEPAKTVEDVVRVRQKIWVALGRAKVQRRSKPQRARIHNPWDHLVAQSAALVKQIEAIPVSQLDRARVQRLTQIVSPIVRKYENATKLLATNQT